MVEITERGLIGQDEFDWIERTCSDLSLQKDLADDFLNIGCNDGMGSCLAILQGGRGRLYCVDPWIGRWDYGEFQKNMTNAGATWRIIEMRVTSDFAFESRIPTNKQFKFIFIDGDHSYPQVQKDVRNAWQHLCKGGIVALHDCDTDGVRMAKDDFGGFACAVRSVWFRKKRSD